jgi:hypothetical protein
MIDGKALCVCEGESLSVNFGSLKASRVRKEAPSAICSERGEGGSSWMGMEGVGDVGKGLEIFGVASHLSLFRALSIERWTCSLLLIEPSWESFERKFGRVARSFRSLSLFCNQS